VFFFGAALGGVLLVLNLASSNKKKTPGQPGNTKH